MAEALSLTTVAHVERCVNSVRFNKGRFIAAYFTTEPGPDGTAKVELTARVKDWRTGRALDTNTYELLRLPTCPREVYQRCYRLYARSAEHEAAESFEVEGRRPYDPHKPRRW